MTVVWSLRSRSSTLPDFTLVISYLPGPSKPPCAQSGTVHTTHATASWNRLMRLSIQNLELRSLLTEFAQKFARPVVAWVQQQCVVEIFPREIGLSAFLEDATKPLNGGL